MQRFRWQFYLRSDHFVRVSVAVAFDVSIALAQPTTVNKIWRQTLRWVVLCKLCFGSDHRSIRARDTTGTTEDYYFVYYLFVRLLTSPNRSREFAVHACIPARLIGVGSSPRPKRQARIVSPMTTTVGSSTFLPTEVTPLVTRVLIGISLNVGRVVEA
jgi:hypothetical protein